MNNKPPKKIEVKNKFESEFSELTLKQLFYVRKNLKLKKAEGSYDERV